MTTLRWWATAFVAAAVLIRATPTRAQGLPSTTPADCVTNYKPAVATEGAPYSALLADGYVTLTGPTGGSLPPGTALDGHTLKGTPTSPGTYSFTMQQSIGNPCLGWSVHGWKMWPPTGKYVRDYGYTIKVRDTHPPVILGSGVTPPTLPAAGGDVVASVSAVDNLAVAKVMVTLKKPDGHGGSGQMPQVGGGSGGSVTTAPATPVPGKWQQTIHLDANQGTAPAVYTFLFTAIDQDGNLTKSDAMTVTVAGRAAGSTLIQGVKP